MLFCYRCMGSYVVFFCKQKTAYERRISDWSSEVCSSDLRRRAGAEPHAAAFRCRRHRDGVDRLPRRDPLRLRPDDPPDQPGPHAGRDRRDAEAAGRSEEHTSELQSLMRISYAVFCLKKKKTQKIDRRTQYKSKKSI